jgi:hypothetical protein
MVCNELWITKNCVAAYHQATKSAILAYYDGIVLDELDIRANKAITYNSTGARWWRPNCQAGLPTWLLTNKLMLKQGMAQFRLKAHWNVFPLGPYQTWCYWIKRPYNKIISLKYARSMSLLRVLLDHQSRPFSIES